MGEAAWDINPNWGRETTPAEAKEFLRKCREAGIVHCIGKSKLDTKWLGIGPGDKLLTVCNCCTCCCITRGIPYVAKNLAEKFSTMPGLRMQVNDDCSGCGKCADTCYIKAITIDNDKAVITKECRACGRCAEICPENAIELIIEDNSYIQNTIKRIEKLADISG
jgi:ferredoxin